MELPALPDSARAARHATIDACQNWGLDGASNDAAVVASELVTNAVLHARTPLLLALEHDGPRLTIAVSDGDDGLPWRLPPSQTRPGGRGIAIVDEIGAAWGVVRTVLGKTVWVQLSLDPALDRDSAPTDEEAAPAAD